MKRDSCMGWKENSPEICTLVSENDILVFLKEIKETEMLTESNLQRFKDIIEMVGYPLTIVCEKDYVDKIYRDTYYSYFASKHSLVDKNCKRLSFFTGYIEPSEFYEYDTEKEEKLKEHFVGICILKPIKVGKIGRTLLAADKMKIGEAYIRTTEYELIILGHIMKIEAFPYSSQDSETMTCAETTVWDILEYFGTRYPEYRTVLPSQLISEIERISQERSLPSSGLDYYEVSELLKVFGFSPRLYAESAFKGNKKKNFKKIFHYYVESGIPLAVGVSGELDNADVKHSVVCIGHGNRKKDVKNVPLESIGAYKYIDSADLYNDYVLMDDNQRPYKIEQFDDFTKYRNSKVVVFAVPLYKRAFLEADDASVLVKEILTHKYIGFDNFVSNIDEEIDDTNPLVVRMYLTSSRKYRSYRAKNADTNVEKNFYATLRLPKFIWIAEVTSYSMYNEDKIYGEILIDATSSRSSHLDSLIMMRYLDYVGVRLPDENIRQLTERIKHRARNFTYPYDMYKNNLNNWKRDRNDKT